MWINQMQSKPLFFEQPNIFIVFRYLFIEIFTNVLNVLKKRE